MIKQKTEFVVCEQVQDAIKILNGDGWRIESLVPDEFTSKNRGLASVGYLLLCTKIEEAKGILHNPNPLG